MCGIEEDEKAGREMRVSLSLLLFKAEGVKTNEARHVIFFSLPSSLSLFSIPLLLSFDSSSDYSKREMSN